MRSPKGVDVVTESLQLSYTQEKMVCFISSPHNCARQTAPDTQTKAIAQIKIFIIRHHYAILLSAGVTTQAETL
jgi:hypothetical protein